MYEPESWYSFYRATESVRLSQPRYCSNDAQPVSKAVYRSGSRNKLSYHHRPLRPACSHTGLNNLAKVVFRQRGGRESNSPLSSRESKPLTTRLPGHFLCLCFQGSVFARRCLPLEAHSAALRGTAA